MHAGKARSFPRGEAAAPSTELLKACPVLWKGSASMCFDSDTRCLASWEIVREQPGSFTYIENVLNVRCPVRLLNLSTVLKFVCPRSSFYAPGKKKRPFIVLHLSLKRRKQTSLIFRSVLLGSKSSGTQMLYDA